MNINFGKRCFNTPTIILSPVTHSLIPGQPDNNNAPLLMVVQELVGLLHLLILGFFFITKSDISILEYKENSIKQKYLSH